MFARIKAWFAHYFGEEPDRDQIIRDTMAWGKKQDEVYHLKSLAEYAGDERTMKCSTQSSSDLSPNT